MRWLEKLKRDLHLAGFDSTIRWIEREPVQVAWVRTAHLLAEAGLSGHARQNLSVKLEIDIRPPAGAKIQRTLVTRHFTFVISHYDLPSLMAGKLHALLTRGYPKGRDWFDLIWYRARRPPTEPNLTLLQHALDQTQGAGRYRAGDWRALLRERLTALDMLLLARDVQPFLSGPRTPRCWSLITWKRFWLHTEEAPVSDFDDLLMDSYELREKLVADKHRPRYHFVPPEGRVERPQRDAVLEGTLPHRLPAEDPQRTRRARLLELAARLQPRPRALALPPGLAARATARHPRRLLQQRRRDGRHGGAHHHRQHAAPRHLHLPELRRRLERWVPLPQNPVIPLDAGERGERKLSSAFPECVIFDPSGWKEGDTYYALVGNKNFRPGYEGDCTSLFKSRDLANWEYVGPFYRSQRRWTAEEEDCACSDFFPFGDRHMLLMHTHRPYGKCQYYVGRHENERFLPERNGQLSWLGSMLAGPETLADGRGRRIFMGWIADARDWETTGWTGVVTLPWHFSPGPDNELKIAPVEELEVLRYDEVRVGDLRLVAGEEVTVAALASDCMEARMTLAPADAAEFGIKLLCSPDGEEETTVTCRRAEAAFVVDFAKASTDTSLRYPHGATRQVVPYAAAGGALDLVIFVDRSVIEIFVNRDLVLVQRVYPRRDDSRQFRIFSRGGALTASGVVKWELGREPIPGDASCYTLIINRQCPHESYTGDVR